MGAFLRHVLLYLLAIAVPAGSFVACKEEPVDARPEQVVETFIQRLKSVHGDPALGRAALELLWATGRKNLEERASRASAAAGRPVLPEEMLAPSRFSLNFEPKTFSAEIKGRHSRVTVTGEDVVKELAEVHCIKENGGWRVIVHLPELPPIDQRTPN